VAFAVFGVELLAGGTQLPQLGLGMLELGQQGGAVRFVSLCVCLLPVAVRELLSLQLLLELLEVRVEGCPLVPDGFEAVGDLCQQPVDLVAVVAVEAPADREMPYLFWRHSRRISLLSRGYFGNKV
jgi:hypothetical protein